MTVKPFNRSGTPTRSQVHLPITKVPGYVHMQLHYPQATYQCLQNLRLLGMTQEGVYDNDHDEMDPVTLEDYF